MNWELLFLVCFVVGFSFSVLSFLGGIGHFHLHLPKHVSFGGGHGIGHAAPGVGPSAGNGAGHAAGHAVHHVAGQTAQHGAAQASASFPFFNPMTAAAFLTWFGGIGYLLVHIRHMWILFGLLFALLGGLIAASLVFLFVVRVLMAHESELDPLDFEMVGVLGKVSIPIRSEGTGEIIFVQQGIRKPCAARTDNGCPLVKGEEVVVTRYDRGVAYVRRWEELANPELDAPEQKTTK
jgi:membrane protein implicated in regulation of membrane protease activity